MARQNGRRTAANRDQAMDGNGRGRRQAQGDGAEQTGSADQDAERRAAVPEAADRLAAVARLTEAAEALTKTQWAILGELRKGRAYRKRNPPPAEPITGPWHGHCEQCGAWYDDDDALVHHQFELHPEIFQVDEHGQPALHVEVECLCRRCNPGAYLAWLQTPEARGT